MFSLALGLPFPKFGCSLDRPAATSAPRRPRPAKRPDVIARPAPERPAATWTATPFPQWNGA